MKEHPDLTSPREVVALFKEHGLQPNKRLGQNFLIDGNIARNIIAALALEPGDAVVEIGPGAGALTLLMAQKKVDIIALEIDRGLSNMLTVIMKSWLNVEIINRNALKVNWSDFIYEKFGVERKVKLISNLPYIISGPFMYSLFESNFPFESAILMFQKEVARRLVARPGESNYGALSVLSQYYTEGKVLFNVPSTVFWPRPTVDSAVIRLLPLSRSLSVEEEKLMWHIVQGSFQQRRKTLYNNLSRLFKDYPALSPAILERASIDPGKRPEELTTGQFAILASLAYNYINKKG
ncbi:MAG: 16S rRNA (adenine(1518)-N(6)/adenine(1519)-N(6))-dimethyltransferase RsmA [Bacillota bacterium]